jgi:hypothetical protein
VTDPYPPTPMNRLESTKAGPSAELTLLGRERHRRGQEGGCPDGDLRHQGHDLRVGRDPPAQAMPSCARLVFREGR